MGNRIELFRKYLTGRIRERHKRLLGLIKENRFKLYMAMACSLLIAATTATSAYLIKYVIDDIFIDKNVQTLMLLPFAVVLIIFLKGIGI